MLCQEFLAAGVFKASGGSPFKPPGLSQVLDEPVKQRMRRLTATFKAGRITLQGRRGGFSIYGTWSLRT